jgi:NitT/TauT family transport system substrate-binding protein
MIQKNILLLLALIFIPMYFVLAQPTRLVFATHWMPQAQFAGYYVAKDQGFYEQAGLDVEIIHPQASVNATQFLENGTADVISLFLITGINIRQRGIDLVNVAQFSKGSAILFVSKKSSGLKSLDDFEGKKVGVWMSGFEEVPQALLQEHKLQVEWVPILSTVNLFMLGGLDVMTVMWYNEYQQLYLSGIDKEEMETFFMADYGYDIPEDGLYVLRETAENRADDLKAFIEATLRGWEYAAQNKEYTVELVIDIMREANISSNKPHQAWMLNKVLEMMNLTDNGVELVMPQIEIFNKAVEIIREQNNPNFRLDYDDFFYRLDQFPAN